MSDIERPVRILLVGRHFWPQGSIDAAGHLMELATGLKKAGMHVSVLSPNYASSCPDQFTFREFSIHRPLRIFRTGWTVRGNQSVSRYIRHLRDWIITNPTACDLVYCDAAREEAIAVVEAARVCQVPAVIRLAGNASRSDMDYFADGKMGKRCRAAALHADAVVLGGAKAERRWLAAGGDRTHAHRIPVGVGPSLDQGLSVRKRLRLSMSRINGDLFVPDDCVVVLSVERLQRDSGVLTLTQSAYSLSQKIKGLQFWLVGDGPSRETIYNQLKGDGLRQSIAMPGSFGLIDDVFVAADLMVHSGHEGFDHQIPMAISAAIPLVIANNETARDFFQMTDAEVRACILERRGDLTQRTGLPPQRTGLPLQRTGLPPQRTGDEPQRTGDETQPTGEGSTDASVGGGLWADDGNDKPGQLIGWFDPARPKTLRFAVEQIVSNLETARLRAQRVRRTFQRTRPHNESIRHYVRLFRQLVEDSAPSRASGTEADPRSMERAR